jgi:hypothetical protein
MARPHSLMVWSVVFALLATASLFAAEAKVPKEPKEPKQKHAKASAAKAAARHSDNPFGGPEERSAHGEKSTSHRAGDPFARPERQSATSPKKPPKPVLKALRPGENVARIEAALASPTEICFVEAPLQEVLDSLKEQHHIEIQIDTKALEDVGIGTDSPVTVDLKGISLRSALKLMLRKLSLTWMIEDEVLLITTPEEAEARVSTILYDVADLVTCRDEHDAPWEDYDTLIDVITPTIQPSTWDMVGGPGAISGATLGTAKVLIVSQTREVQEQIADLLAKIREVAKKNPNAGIPRRSRPAQKVHPSRQALCGENPVITNEQTAVTSAAPAAAKPGHETQPPKSETPKTPK